MMTLLRKLPALRFLQLTFDRKSTMIYLIAALLTIYLTTTVVARTTATKLIKYGWDAPSPDFFRKHIKEMEQRPFDGVILKLNAGKEVFKRTAYPNAAFTQDRRDLAATKSARLTDNFIVMWSGMDPGWDWFNDTDWKTAQKNIQNFAKTAQAGRFQGIAFDSEPYTTSSPWKYRQQPQHPRKTFAQYQQQVRKRGAQFMRTLQSEQPKTQLLTFGLLSWLKDLWAQPLDATQLQQRLANHDYGLWPAFINGMLEASQPGAVIIDGNEWAYYYYLTAWFDETRDSIFKKARIFVDPKNYRKYADRVKVGQSVYTDLILDIFPNQRQDPRYGKTTQHFLSPEDRLRLLEHNLYHSLRTTDRYTWLYSESADWWQQRIPPGAEAVIKRAQAKIKAGQPLGFNIEPAVYKALKQCQAVSQNC